MSSRPVAAAFALLIIVAMPAPARADQLHFTGQTRVDGAVVRDAMQNVAQVAAGAEHCNQLTAVEASLLPDGWAPSDPAYRVGPAASTRYERWDVSLCGRTVPFLLGFWPAPEGGMMFQVGYPYPEAAPAR
jgi:hypothetical protein